MIIFRYAMVIAASIGNGRAFDTTDRDIKQQNRSKARRNLRAELFIPESHQHPCQCESCSQEVLNSVSCDSSGCFSCQARIDWLQSIDGGSLSEYDACTKVAAEEFPDICGLCDSSSCTSKPSSTPTDKPSPAPTDSPSCSKSELQCRAKDNAADAELEAAVDWACGSDNIYVLLDCDQIYTNNGISSTGSNINKANVVFDAYWNGANRVPEACCFASDGQNCIAEVSGSCIKPVSTALPTTYAPSASPSKAPVTLSPTRSPSDSPSMYPTPAPTLAPTGSPTRVPTQAPTSFPTPIPSASPVTNSPTLSGTSTPSANSNKCGGAVNSSGNSEQQCQTDLWTPTSDNSMHCFAYGGSGDPCHLNNNNDPNDGLDKDPSLCVRDTLYLWDEPDTQGKSYSWAGSAWLDYSRRFADKLTLFRSSGGKVTSPLLKAGGPGVLEANLREFYDACGASCSDPNDVAYINVIAVNAFCGPFNGDAGCRGGASFIYNEATSLSSSFGNIAVYITNWSKLQTSDPNDQVDAIEAIEEFFPNPDSIIERVYWFGATDFGGGSSNNFLTNVLPDTTTLGDRWRSKCREISLPGIPTQAPSPMPSPFQVDYPCGCRRCTVDVLNSLACAGSDCHTCSNRIEWLVSPNGGSLSDAEACVQVAGDEFPDVCGACNPQTCQFFAPSTPSPVATGPTLSPVQSPVQTIQLTSLPPNSDINVESNQRLIVPSSSATHLASNILVKNGGELIIEDETSLQVRRIEIAEGGTFIVGPNATNVNIELVHDDCRWENRRPDDGAGDSTCLLAGQIVSRGNTRIHGAPVTSWTLISAPSEVGSFIQVEKCDGWVPGAGIVIAMGYRQDAAQERIIAGLESSENGCQVELTEPLSQPIAPFTRFQTIDPIYQEVLYLERNVKITGTLYGAESNIAGNRQGVVISQRHTGSMQMSNTLVENCGRNFIGEYCLHLHMLKDAQDSFFKGNAVTSGINKGIVIHGVHRSTVENNAIYGIAGNGIYVEDGNEMQNNIINNAVGCASMTGCPCVECVPSQSFGDVSRQAQIYSKSASQNFIGNHAFGGLVCLLYDYQNVVTPCSVHLPFGVTDGNVFHCKQFGWYPTDAFPRNVNQDIEGDGIIRDTNSCKSHLSDGTSNGKEAVISNHVEYDIRDFGAGSYDFSDIVFTGAKIEGRTALYTKTYWRSEGTRPFCTDCELISNPYVGLNLAGGDALFEFEDTTLPEGMLQLPHHGYANGGLLASQILFSGDTSRVDIRRIDPNEGGNPEPNAIVVTVGDTNHILDVNNAAFNNFEALGCSYKFNGFPKILSCDRSGSLRPLKIYSWGPSPITVKITNVDGTSSTHIINHYNKKSNAVDRYDADPSLAPVYMGYAFVVRAGATVTVTATNDITAVDFGHSGWPENQVEEINLTINAPRGGVTNCRLRTDHPRKFYTPFGPLKETDPITLCV